MYCRKCGHEIHDEAVVCVNCGCAVEENSYHAKPEHNTSKTVVGVLFALLLGLIGLIIGICMYPEETVARKSFLKAWGITYGVSIGISLLISIVFGAFFMNLFI